MKSLLRSLLAFLDHKFPDRVVVTIQEYNQLYEQLGAYNQILQAFDKRVFELNKALEDLKKPDTSFQAFKDDVQHIVNEQGLAIQKVQDEVGKLQVVMGFSRGQAPLER